MKNLILIFSLLIIFIACNQNSLTYKSGKGYSFKYSEKQWEIEENTMQTLLFNKQEKESDFKSNINIIVQDLAGHSMTLADYHHLTLSQMEEALGRNTVQSDKEIKISGKLAKEIVYTMPQNVNKANTNELKLKQIYFIKNNKAYLITYTAKMDDFDTFLSSANEIFETLKVE